MNNISIWIKHLRHPLVLAGFALFVFALIVKPLFLNITNLSGAEAEQLLRLAMLLLFILAATAVAGGIALNWQNDSAADKQSKAPAAAVPPVAPKFVKEQEIPAANSEKGNSLSITASGQGEVSIGADLINADGNVEKNDAQ
jgi:hypothetical protein